MASQYVQGAGGGQKASWWHSFKQQRMRVWQPIFTPRFIIPFYLVCGLVFLGLGAAFVFLATGVTELRRDYTDVAADNGTGNFTFTVESDLEPPIWIYYELSAFYQNHRRYVKSYSGLQLSNQEHRPGAALDEISRNCNPEEVRRGRGDRVLYPCGLVPLSIFNDTFALVRQSEDGVAAPVVVNSSAATIAWPADITGKKFKNIDPEEPDPATGLRNEVALDMWILEKFPPVECVQRNFSDGYKPVRVATRTERVLRDNGVEEEVEGIVDCTGYKSEPMCNFTTREGDPFECELPNYEQVQRQDWGVESGHLVVWMRIAGLPTFRKLLGRVDEKLEMGTYTVYFENNFPVRKFGGHKSLVLSTGSEWGSHSDSLGWSYIMVGACCIFFGLWKAAHCAYRPQSLGDVGLLSR